MKSFIRFLDAPIRHKTAVAIGKFDGVHTGHKALINQLCSHAKAHALVPLVLIVEPHPQTHFTKQRHARLMSMRMKYDKLHALGVPQVGLLLFHKVAHLSPINFIKHLLVEQCHCAYLIIGEGFRFGYAQQGTVETLQQFSHHFVTQVLENQRSTDRQVISSSRIKQLLHTGDIAQANELLGYTYALAGKVIAGKQRGRTLGFPTANIHTNSITPLSGVYYGHAQWQGHSLVPAVANIGSNPTFETDKTQRIEVHLLEGSPTLYGKRICFTPLGQIRKETHYDSMQALQEAIGNDVVIAKSRLAQRSKS